ncbi:hypothetical protein [Bacillus sp. V59.32b]|uniref:hypothetical protein n=1 Tax=Bacillus sp. V59.32b TaxID=1758642 RepID=UPI000E3C2CE9|nr:hypothetical protein [Bacillus sp. V59.32b]RFU68564.1 hypothetical protein D0463_04660 [Bacillus sp. V59.32b]
MGKKNKTDDFYEALKVMGAQKEKELNRKIKDLLNDKRIIKLAGMESHIFAKIVQHLQESMETLSAFGNFPTKRDIANVAKMQVQLENKIDHIEELLSEATTDSHAGQSSDSMWQSAKRDKQSDKRNIIKKLLKDSLIQGTKSLHE